MSNKTRRRLISSVILGLVGLYLLSYLFPVPNRPFARLYDRVDPGVRASLLAFRQNNPLQYLEVNKIQWEYIVTGEGEHSLLFLHGLTGSYDIWWQQIEALKENFHIVSVTYPAIDNLRGLADGILAILDKEGISKVTVIGTSLGGYLAQYLVATYPGRIEKAVFSNTFPPNEVLKKQYGILGSLIPYTPEWLIMTVLRVNVSLNLYPAAGNSETLRAFLVEQTYGRMQKEQILARYRSVVEPFEPPDPGEIGFSVLIIESDNDPLLTPELRQQMKGTYPTATVITLHAAGHFPYLSSPENYTNILEHFLLEK